MKSSNDTEAASGSGYTTGWNARRSYNLLRLSLGHAMSAPLFVDDNNDNDDMELDELNDDMESSLNAMAERLSNGTSVSQSTDMELGSPKLREEGKSNTTDDSPNAEISAAPPPAKALDGAPEIESPTLGLVEDAKVSLPALNTTRVPSDAPPGLHSPTRSVSPKGNKKPGAMFGLIPLAENEDVVDFGAAVVPEGMTAIRRSNSLPSPSPRDRLAASLQKGLQILDNHQKSSLRR